MNELATKTILVVDDEPLLQKLWQDELLSLGHNVLLAQNGNEAIKVIKKEKVDLILTDLKMPQSDGIEILEFLKKNPDKKIPVILCSGFLENAEEYIRKYNLIRFMVKPFNLDEEVKFIQNFFRPNV